MAAPSRHIRRMETAITALRRVGGDRILRVLFLLGISLAVFLAVGRSGFNITDEGLVLDWSYRILHGAIPHRDIIDAHLQGSGLFHILDLAAPTPVLATSRLIAITEIVTYSAVLAAITFATPFRRWRLTHLAGVVAATVINIHTFPLMAWYTFDGILFCSVGIYLLMSSPRPLPARRVTVAMSLLGAAALMKQSFGPAAPLGALTVVVLSFREGWRPCLAKSVMAGAMGLLPFGAYSGWVAAAGGFPDMIRQLTSATPVWGEQFLNGGTLGPQGPGAVANLPPLLFSVALAFVAVLGGARLRTSGYAWGRSLQRLGLVVGGATIAVTLALSRLSPAGIWGLPIEGFLVSWLVLNAAVRLEFDGTAFWFAALGWMVSLSWGPASNELVAGSIVILVLQRLWAAAHVRTRAVVHARRPGMRAMRGGAVVVGPCLLLAMAYQARQANPYRDLTPDMQTSRPGQIAAAYGWIETGAPTMAYLRQVDDCIAAHPASRISIVPDTPAQHVVYDRAAALPVSLLDPPDYRGSETQILEAARRLDAEGDYLVLFQSTWDGQGYYKGLPATTSLGTPVWDYGDHDFYSSLQADLTGERFVCGSLIAVYKPPAG